tara:strand:- start:1361 stop:1516 length:156 start_codon:yes stop_codon:yes gene_type:complete
MDIQPFVDFLLMNIFNLIAAPGAFHNSNWSFDQAITKRLVIHFNILDNLTL